MRNNASNSDAPSSWKRSLYLIWIAQCLVLTGSSFVFPFLPFYIQELGITEIKQVAVWAGMLQAAPSFSLVIAAPMWGVLADKFSKKLMLKRAMFSIFVILILSSLVRNVYQLFALRILQGFFAGSVSAANVLVASIIPRERSGYGLGLMQTAHFIGATIGPFLGGFAADIWGYRNSFLVSGIMVLTGFFLIHFWIQDPPKEPRNTTQSTLSPETIQNQQTWAFTFAFLLVILLLVKVSFTIVTPIVPLFIKKIAASTRYIATTAGAIIAASGFAGMISAIAIGKVSDRGNHRQLLFLLLLVAGIFTLLSAMAKNPAQFLLFRVGAGFATGGIMPLINSNINLGTSRDKIGKSFGIASSISAIGTGFGPLIGGAIVSILSMEATFLFGGSMLILTAISSTFLLKNLPGGNDLMIKIGQEGN
ncbi:MAG: MFS transporter [Candidatus Ratteibacteria bacterium]|jgi:DHA1 family multidrug resistance protein-like MFS transporter